MLNRSPLPQLTIGRILETGERLKAKVWSQANATFEIRSQAPTPKLRPLREVKEEAWSPLTTFPEVWGPYTAHRWYEVKITSGPIGPDHYIEWRDQGESTVYLKDEPWHGVDGGHTRAPLPEGTEDFKVEAICINTGIWSPGYKGDVSPEGSKLERPILWKKDVEAWKVSLDFAILVEYLRWEYKKKFPDLEGFNRNNGVRPAHASISHAFRHVLERLDRAIDRYDHEGTAALQEELEAIFASMPGNRLTTHARLTGHAHIDLVWLWPEHCGEFKAVHTFSNALWLMDQYPEFRFNYTQPASYEAVRRINPKLIERVQEKLKSKQWEATGASYVESDTQLSCGENLLRSFLLGQEGFEELRGSRASVLWIPDVFGYAGCLPQMMKECDVQYFFTTKLTWGNINRFPYSSFKWKGIDGSEILTHVTQATGYNCATHLEEIQISEEQYVESGKHNSYLIPTGYGDGGGGVSEDMCYRARRMESLAGVPNTEWTLIEEFFEDLNGKRDALPVYQGELFLEYHRGVQTTHGDLKYAFRIGERALQIREAAACLENQCEPLPTPDWKRLVFGQFHDYIPGSSIPEVYDEAIPELRDIAQRNVLQAKDALKSADKAPAFFNPLPQPVQAWFSEKKSWVTLPPLSSSSDPTPIPTEKVSIDGLELKSKRVRLELDSEGCFVSFRVDSEDILWTRPGGELQYYPDFPQEYPAWDIDRSTLANGRKIEGFKLIQKENLSDGSAELIYATTFGEKSSIQKHIRLDPVHPWVEVRYTGSLEDSNTLLKVIYPTAYMGRTARFGLPFCSVQRVQQQGDPKNEAFFEVAGSRWATVTDEGEREGFFLATEAKYGFSVQDGTLGLSLIRSAEMPGKNLNLKLRGRENKSQFSDIGPFNISTVVGRVQDNAVREEHPSAIAESAFTLPLALESENRSAGFQGLDAAGESLQPVWAKPTGEGSWVLRLHEVAGRRGKAKLQLDSGWQAELVDMMERKIQDLPDGKIPFQPNQIVSVRLRKS